MATAGYLPLNGSNQYVSTTNKSQLQITGTIEMIFCLQRIGEPTGDTWAIQKANSAETQGYGMIVGLSDGEVVGHFGDGTGRYFTSTAALPGGGDAWLNPVWIRVQLIPNNGSNQKQCNFHYSFEAPETPVGSLTWTQLGVAVTQSGATSISTSSDVFELCRAPWNGDLIAGRIYYAEVRAGIDGTPVFRTDFRTNTGGWDSPPGADGLGNTITFQGSSTWVADIPDPEPPEGGTSLFFWWGRVS